MNFAERVNLHTHTARCGHATGARGGVSAARPVNQGVAVLGFSDHAPFPDGRYPESRMDYSELPAYLDDIERMRSRFPELVLLAGAEVDYLQSVGRAFYEETYSAAKGSITGFWGRTSSSRSWMRRSFHMNGSGRTPMRRSGRWRPDCSTMSRIPICS